MAKEYVAICQIPSQITEWEWIISNPTMKVTTETTIAEIDYFFKQNGKVGPTEFKIIELQ